MEQLSFVVSSIVFVHFLLPYHVLLVKMRILNSLDFLDIHSASGCLKSARDILVLRGAWVESHSVHCHVRVWHWNPRAWKRYCCETKQSQFLLVLLCCWKSKLVIANLECFRLEVYFKLRMRVITVAGLISPILKIYGKSNKSSINIRSKSVLDYISTIY